jgi:hypothetical protein
MNYEYWTSEELETLKRIYSIQQSRLLRKAQLAEQLPGRSSSGINAQLHSLGLCTPKTPTQPWTDESRRQLRDLWADTPIKEIGVIMGRTASSVRGEAFRMKLPCKQEWVRVLATPALDKAITAAYCGTQRNYTARVAEKFGVSKGWIKYRARVLGLTRSNGNADAWTPEEDAMIEDLHDRGGARYVSQQLKKAGFIRSTNAVESRLHHIGLSWRNRDIYNATEFSKLMGVDFKTVTHWIRTGYLKAHRENVSGLHNSDEPWNYMITHRHAREFLRQHVARYRLSTVDRYWFVATVAGDSSGHNQDTRGKGDGGGFDEMSVAA